MNIKLLKDDDRQEVLEALYQFYSLRPNDYALEARQKEWDKYADLISSYTKPGGRVLELGSGNWRVPYKIYERGFDVDGCDVWSEDYLAEQIHQMPKKGPQLIRYDGSTLPYPVHKRFIEIHGQSGS